MLPILHSIFYPRRRWTGICLHVSAWQADSGKWEYCSYHSLNVIVFGSLHVNTLCRTLSGLTVKSFDYGNINKGDDKQSILELRKKVVLAITRLVREGMKVCPKEIAANLPIIISATLHDINSSANDIAWDERRVEGRNPVDPANEVELSTQLGACESLKSQITDTTVRRTLTISSTTTASNLVITTVFSPSRRYSSVLFPMHELHAFSSSAISDDKATPASKPQLLQEEVDLINLLFDARADAIQATVARLDPLPPFFGSTRRSTREAADALWRFTSYQRIGGFQGYRLEWAHI